MFFVSNRAPSPLLEQHRISVSSIGDRVRLELGNVLIDLPYETAFQLSMWLRMHAKAAKRTAGDTSRDWRVVAALDVKGGQG